MSSDQSVDKPLMIDPQTLPSSHMAAALLLSVERETAMRLLRQFDEGEIREIATASVNLPTLTPNDMSDIIRRFEERLSTGAALTGGLKATQELLSGTMPEDQLTRILELPSEDAENDFWKRMSSIPDDVLRTRLETEHPQILAYILSKLPTAKASRLGIALSPERRDDALARMLSQRAVSSAISDLAMRHFRRTLIDSTRGSQEAALRHHVAAIVNTLDSPEASRAIKSLKVAHPEALAQLSKLLFSFEQLPLLSTQSLAFIFDRASTDLIVKSLHGIDRPFRDAVLAPMAGRARRVVEAELSSGNSVSDGEIAKARREIVSIVLDLARGGIIELPKQEDAEPTLRPTKQ